MIDNTSKIRLAQFTALTVVVGAGNIEKVEKIEGVNIDYGDEQPLYEETVAETELSDEINTYILTINTIGSDLVKVVPDRLDYLEGTIVTLEAEAENGWYFVEWTGDVSDIDSAITTVTMADDRVITAEFIELPTIASIAEVNDIAVEYGTLEADAVLTLAETTTITDSEGAEHTVILSWSIANYYANIAGKYTATGNFVLPPGVAQSDPEMILEVTTKVIVREYTPFEFDYSTGTITGYNEDMGGLNVVIPPEINGVKVISIGGSAFHNKNIETVEIGNNVTSIGLWAFKDNNISSVAIPDSVTTIGTQAFRNNLLTLVVIPDSVTSIGVGAFDNNNISSVVIPDSITVIGYRVFINNNLKSNREGSHFY